MTPQQKMADRLHAAGLPHKEIKCYGSQIMVKAWSRDAAEKWAALLATFAKVRGMTESHDYAKVNKNTMLKPSTVPVWLVWATV